MLNKQEKNNMFIYCAVQRYYSVVLLFHNRARLLTISSRFYTMRIQYEKRKSISNKKEEINHLSKKRCLLSIFFGSHLKKYARRSPCVSSPPSAYCIRIRHSLQSHTLYSRKHLASIFSMQPCRRSFK